MLTALKIILAPFFIALVSLAGRRWGSTVSGLLIGLPLTSGPISILLALQYGREFAAAAAAGNIAGQVSTCIFCAVYALLAVRANWLASSSLALAAYFVTVFAWNQVSFGLMGALLGLLAVMAVGLRIMPRPASAERSIPPPAWDLPARMLAATAFVLILTGSARLIGPRLAGMLSPFPIFGLVLSVFTHRQQGGDSAARMLRAMVLGSSAYMVFFVVVGVLLPVLSIAVTYLLASLATIAMNALAFIILRKVKLPTPG